MKRFLLVVILFFGLIQINKAQTKCSCKSLLDEYSILVDSLVLIAHDFHLRSENDKEIDTQKFLTTKMEINNWYTKWNASSCKTVSTYQVQYEELETKKKDAIRKRYALN